MKSLENRIPPPLLVMIIGAVMVGSSHFLPSSSLLLSWRYPLLIIFFVVGGLCGFPAIKAFAQAKTTINPVDIEKASTLVTTGIYRYTRNPMYVGLTTILLCLAAYLAVPVTYLGPLVFVIFINRFQIAPEERVLMSKFGKSYEDYCLYVRRWI